MSTARELRPRVRGTVRSPFLVQNDHMHFDKTHWKMTLAIHATAANSYQISRTAIPRASLFRVPEGRGEVTPVYGRDYALQTGFYDVNFNRDDAGTIDDPVAYDIRFEFNELKFPGPGTYFYKVEYHPYGYENSERFTIPPSPPVDE